AFDETHIQDLLITVEDKNAWNEYVKICVKDRASGVQVEHAYDVDNFMSKEASVDEEGSTFYIDL
ncbi:hypothetical protein RYX36_001377, partial [Vicia faba]